MANTLTELNLANQAFRLIGEMAVSSLAITTNPKVSTWNEHFVTTRDELLESHFWNFATVRTTLVNYTTPAAILTPGAGATTVGTPVVFTADAPVFSAADVGRTITAVDPIVGAALITGFTTTITVTATIAVAFAGLTPLASSTWRLVNPAPTWGFGVRLSLPTDYLRVQRVRGGEIYQREGDYFVCGSSSLDFTYTQRLTDITRWPAYFVAALVAAMVAKMAEPVTGQRAKQVDWFTIAEKRLARAKLMDGMEGSPHILRANDLANARFGGGHLTTTEE